MIDCIECINNRLKMNSKDKLFQQANCSEIRTRGFSN